MQVASFWSPIVRALLNQRQLRTLHERKTALGLPDDSGGSDGNSAYDDTRNVPNWKLQKLQGRLERRVNWQLPLVHSKMCTAAALCEAIQWCEHGEFGRAISHSKLTVELMQLLVAAEVLGLKSLAAAAADSLQDRSTSEGDDMQLEAWLGDALTAQIFNTTLGGELIESLFEQQKALIEESKRPQVEGTVREQPKSSFTASEIEQTIASARAVFESLDPDKHGKCTLIHLISSAHGSVYTC